MTEGGALLYAYFIGGKGGGKILDWPAIDNWDSGQGLLWIHLDPAKDRASVTQEDLNNIEVLTKH